MDPGFVALDDRFEDLGLVRRQRDPGPEPRDEFQRAIDVLLPGALQPFEIGVLGIVFGHGKRKKVKGER